MKRFQCIGMLMALTAVVVNAQDWTGPCFTAWCDAEVIVDVRDRTNGVQNTDSIVWEAMSTVWTWWSAGDTASHDSVVPNKEDVLRYGARAGNDQMSNRLFLRAYQMDLNPVTCNEGNCVRRCFNWGLYKVSIKWLAPGYDYWTTRDSFYVDLIDENYSRYYVNGSYDFSFSYDWDTVETKRFTKCVPGDDSTFGSFPRTYVRVYDTAWISPYPLQFPRKTKYFKPAPPDEFAISAYQSHPRLTWRSNGETFPVIYEVYRRTGSGSFSRIAQLPNTGYPDNSTTMTYVDTDITGQGTDGRAYAYYYLLVVNASEGSSRVSDPTPTLSFRFDPNVQKTISMSSLDFGLSQNVPNPFNPWTTISYSVPETELVSLKIFNVLGQDIRTLVHGVSQSGLQNVMWDGKDDSGRLVSSGVYLCRLVAGRHYAIRTMSFMK